MNAELVERLARLRGIGDAYHDYRGELQYFSLETKAGILRAMGVAVDDDGSLAAQIRSTEIARWRGLLPPVAAARGPRIGFDVNIAALEFGASLRWNVELEDGTRREGALSSADCPEVWRGNVEGSWVTRRRFELPLDLPAGYHTLEARIAAGPPTRCALIIAPPHCHEPPSVAAGGRLWGVAVQLYTVRSRRNWGIGDFADLQQLIRWLAPRGAGFIGLNPLHALSPADPERASPYSASNRHFLNVLYIAVPQVPEYDGCAATQRRAAEPHFAQQLEALRAADRVDYAAVARLKLEMLELLYQDFRQRVLQPGGARAREFRAFVAAGGAPLRHHALFDALDRHFRGALGVDSGWLSWPEEYRDVGGAAAARFARENPAQVEFFQYLQWLAHTQLGDAQRLARTSGMTVGLYGDYAVGANAAGSETWSDAGEYCLGAEIGAPPDPIALRGQGWGIPPQDPEALQRDGMQGFVRLIRDNMRHYGALRLDHVMSLFRLWWIAARSSPTQGAYVHYPLHMLFSVVALESARNGCLVVGEDLGVVPDEIRAAMPLFGLYHYKVVLFEKQAGAFRRPADFERHALATVTTHDMPTLRSYWDGRDIELRERLNLYPSAAILAQVGEERSRDRQALLEALRAENLSPAEPASTAAPFTAELAAALHLYLARSTAALVALQLEDLLGMTDPVNVPGTSDEYPNWQRKMSADLEDIAVRAELRAQLDAIDRARRTY